MTAPGSGVLVAVGGTGVLVGVLVGPGVNVSVGKGVLVQVVVGVGVLFGVLVGPGVYVLVAVGVLVRVAVAVGVFVGVFVGAGVLVGPPATMEKLSPGKPATVTCDGTQTSSNWLAETVIFTIPYSCPLPDVPSRKFHQPFPPMDLTK